MTSTPQQFEFTNEDLAERLRKQQLSEIPEEPVLLGDEYPVLWRMDQLANRPKPNWLIRHVIEEKGLTTFFGPDKVGKTAMLSQMLWAWVAGHANWFDEEFEMTDALDGNRSVLYVLLEGQAAFYDRYDAWRHAYDEDGLRLEKFWVMDEGLSLFSSSMRWDDQKTWPDSAKKLFQAVAVLRPKVLVIDTLSRATAGMDENSSQMSHVIGFLDYLRNLFGVASVVVHHVALSDGDRPRGHSSLKGATSSYVRVEGDPVAEVQKLVTGPHRNAESWNPAIRGEGWGWNFKRVSARRAFYIEPAVGHKKGSVLDKIVGLILQNAGRGGIKAKDAGIAIWPEEDKWKTIYNYCNVKWGVQRDEDGYLSYEAPAKETPEDI